MGDDSLLTGAFGRRRNGKDRVVFRGRMTELET